MDDNFFKNLDEALTNVGTDKYWERTIGGHVVWLSPVPFKSQHKINELLTNQELGTNVIGEVKRATLSYAIVGFDGHDLRPYRNETPQFPYLDPHEKKQVKVALHKYLSHKIGEWGTEWVDAAFEVFADIMETVRKENLKEVKFENAKDKKEELAELEEKVRELRIELEMPVLVELKPEEEKVLESKEAAPELASASPSPAVSLPAPAFNPFQKLPQPASEPAPAPLPAMPAPVPSPPPVQRPVAADGATSSPERPYMTGRESEVIEERPVREPLPIEINPNRQSVNPRFKQVR